MTVSATEGISRMMLWLDFEWILVLVICRIIDFSLISKNCVQRYVYIKRTKNTFYFDVNFQFLQASKL